MCLYWRLLSGESALLVLTCRMVWSCVFIVLLCSFVKRTKFLHLMRDPRALLTFITSGVLTSANWGVYIWAANSGHLLETSIGYYLCPLFNILFGLIVFHERLTRMQKVAFGLAACGVTFFIAVNGGAIWISFAGLNVFRLRSRQEKGRLPGPSRHGAVNRCSPASWAASFSERGRSCPRFGRFVPQRPTRWP
ncbi:MAG: EamA family transporter [Slackia sp.]